MVYLQPLFMLFWINQVFQEVHGQCSGGRWSIEEASIGSFTLAWRYKMASNTVQFLIQGRASTTLNLTSTYVAIGWSETPPDMNHMDVAMFFPGSQLLQDRHSREHLVPLRDDQDDLCLLQTNIADRTISLALERLVNTGDVNDIPFTSNLYLTFFMGLYTSSVEPQAPFFRQSLESATNLVTCHSTECRASGCTLPACPCVQDVRAGSAQCRCFPSESSCTFGPTESTSVTNASVSAIMNGSCRVPINPCSANGICLQILADQFICQCKAGYTGVLCQTPLFSLNPRIHHLCPCVNGGTCLSNSSCSCPSRYRGKHCQLVNPCHEYCYNDSRCSVECTDTSCGQPKCTCTSGFSGIQCDRVDSCLSNPCQQGTCLSSSNCLGQLCGYSCLCPNGTTGAHCEIGADPCWNNPCQNGGRCSASSNTFVCQCLAPYGGSHCDLLLNICTPNPCLNNGQCLPHSVGKSEVYQCICPSGYMGLLCEHVNGCASSPCQNGSEGEDKESSCSIGFCLNGGTCRIHNSTHRPVCQCPADTQGDRCERIISACTPATCLNGGVCFIDASSTNRTARCICPADYTDEHCESLITPSQHACSANPCGSNETSKPTSCAASPCHYLSTCQQIEKSNGSSTTCLCPSYLTGDRCQYPNHCQQQPCLNQGTCLPLAAQNSFVCLCAPGFGHYDCSIHLGSSCHANVCLNGGVCDQNGTNIRCICADGFAGPRCEWTSVCSTNTCDNGGTCRQIAPTMAECLCQAGFTGPTCRLRDTCATTPCKNGGGCITLLADTGTSWSAYRCVCPSGIYGQNCDAQVSSCATMVCPAYKICSEQPTGPVCTCPGNKVGTFCQYDHPCRRLSDCQNGGTCVASNTDPPVRTCICPERYTGERCEIPPSNDPCASNPCQTRGHCALAQSNQTYTCICHNQFIGEHCERSNPCSSSPCLNQAVCQAEWNQTYTWFTCRCLPTYTGARCETSLLNPCGGLCMNGSPCSNGMCVCPAQYTGTFCGFENPCYHPVCSNGGLCSVLFNSTSVSYTCTCPSSYTGDRCETLLSRPANGSCSSACLNNGSCVNGLCVCTEQYIGDACQYKNPCSNQNPCLNSGTCFGRYHINGTLSTQCFCPQGHTGLVCEATLCSPTSCNGGVCTATQNNIVCVCPTGKSGDRCQYVDACANQPCLADERCEQAGNHYQCISCYDKSSYCSIYQLRNEYCDNRYTILVDNNFLPVPQACRRACGQCIPVQRLRDVSILAGNGTSIEETDLQLSTTTTMPSRQQERCIDRRDDCLMQKAYGFCRILNDKYPDDCVKTCHPDCATLS